MKGIGIGQFPFFDPMHTNIDNIQLHYAQLFPECKYDDQGPILLFIHEALGSIPQWKSFPQELCNQLGMEGIIYERQGHGHSSPFTEPRTERYLHNYAWNELPPFIEKVIPQNREIILIGHSDGGTIALLYTAKYPERIKFLVTMAAHVINEPETIEGIHPAVNAWELGKLKGLEKYHGEKTTDLFFAWADMWKSKAFADWNITTDINNTSIPGLFIQGSDDQYGTHKQLDLIQQAYPNGKQYMIDHCGHHPHLEQTEKVIALIEQWLG